MNGESWCGLYSGGSEQGLVVNSCEYKNKTLSPKKNGESFNQLKDYQLLKENFPP
jgi:hypothetical protein